MENKYIVSILLTFFVIFSIFSLQFIYAITANSSDYSTNLFGTGIQSSSTTSSTYEAIFLSTSNPSTRNAEANSSIVNIGFFENTTFAKIVSISSYSIYPDSAVLGSIIRFSISAINYTSAWIEITKPNNIEEIINISNNEYKYYLANISGEYDVTFYAKGSGGEIASSLDSFTITEPTTPSDNANAESGGGGGGGTDIVVEKCAYIWECSPWDICDSEFQKRVCKNTGDCEGEEGKPIEQRVCSDALFDVLIKFKDLIFTQNEALNFYVELTETKGIEKIDVFIKYSIINSSNVEVFSQTETRAIESNLSYQKEFSELHLANGKYKLIIGITYGNLQRAFAEQEFVVKGSKLNTLPKKINLGSSIFLGILILIILIIFVLIFFLVKKYSNKEKKHPKK